MVTEFIVQEVCELVIRQRMGYITQIHMGCKQKMACENNKAQNFQNSNPAYTQCRPEVSLRKNSEKTKIL